MPKLKPTCPRKKTKKTARVGGVSPAGIRRRTTEGKICGKDEF